MTSSIIRRVRTAIPYHLIVIALGAVMLYPVLWLVASSFKDASSIFLSSGRLVPKHFTFANYAVGWSGFGGITFGRFLLNSLIISISSTLGQVLSSSAVAYGFARITFRGKNLWFTCMIATLLLPYQVIMLPQYIMFSKVGWLNSYRPLIVPEFFGNAFFIFLIMQFIRGIPFELDESARIDGCGRYATFARIIFPLIKPALITVAIFSFYWRWQDFYGPLLYIEKPKLYPMSLALKLFSDPTTITNWGAMFAMSSVSLIPVVLVFIFFQKYIVEGISASGLKG